MTRWADVRSVIRGLSDFRIRMPQPRPSANLRRTIRYLRQMRAGYRNACFLERCADWVLPYWAGRQEDPADEAFIPRAQSSLAYNQTNRNWTVAGPALGTETVGSVQGWPGAIVDPRGLITPFGGGWSLDFWLDIGGKLYTPLQAQSLKQYLGDPVPEVNIVWQAGPVTVRTGVVAFKTGTFPWLGCTITLTANLEENLKQVAEQAVRLLMVIRPYNPEGFAPIKSIKYTMDGFIINGRMTLLSTGFPDRVICTDGTRGDGVRLIDGPMLYFAESSAGLAHAVAAFDFDLGGQSGQDGLAQAQPQTQSLNIQTQPLEVFVPLGIMKKGFRPTAVSRQVFLSDLGHEWQEHRSAAMRVTLPDQRLSEAVRANLAFALTFADHKAAGRWITDGDGGVAGVVCGEQPLGEPSAEQAILAAALDRWGLHQAAGKIIEQMLGIDRSNPKKIVAGNLAQVEQAIWALQKHNMLAINDAMPKDAYDHIAVFFPSLRRFGVSNNGKTGGGKASGGKAGNGKTGRRRLGRPGPGSGPVPRLRGFWNAAALRDASLLAQCFGKKAEVANGLRQTYADVRARIVKDISRTAQVTDLMAIALLGLIAPDDGLAADLLKNVLGVGMDAHKQGLYYNPQMSGYDLATGFLITQCLVMMRDDQVYASLEQILAMALSTYAWPRAVHPRTGGGSFGEGHDPLVTAMFLWVIRSMLIREENDSLILGAAFPAHWYEPGTVIAVDKAPTGFGGIGYRIEAGIDQVELQLEGEYRFPPQNVRWDVPFTIKSAVVNDREALHREHTILLLPQTRKVVLNRE